MATVKSSKYYSGSGLCLTEVETKLHVMACSYSMLFKIAIINFSYMY